MHEKTKRRKEAKRLFMENADFCITCNSVKNLTPSHLFKVNALWGKNDPCDLDLIVCQCWNCHRQYELLNVEQRIQYWKDRKLTEIADRMEAVVSA
jgi:hypothetical protein